MSTKDEKTNSSVDNCQQMTPFSPQNSKVEFQRQEKISGGQDDAKRIKKNLRNSQQSNTGVAQKEETGEEQKIENDQNKTSGLENSLEKKDPRNIFIAHLSYLCRNNIPLPFLVIKHPKDTIFSSLKVTKVSASQLNHENILSYLRSSVFCSLNELKTIYEGEITQMSLSNHIHKITLRSQKGTQMVTVKEEMYEKVLAEDLLIGDIVHIEPNGNTIRKLGRSENKFECDIEKGKKLALPKDEVEKIRYIGHTLSFDELDAAAKQAKCPNGGNVENLIVANETDEQVMKYMENGLGEIETGVLLISDVHLIDLPLLQRIINTMESSKFNPVVLLCTEDVEFTKKHSEFFKNILCVQLYNTKVSEEQTNQQLSEILDQNLTGLDEKVTKEMKQIAAQKGFDFAFSLLDLARSAKSEEFEEIVRHLDV